MAGSGYLVFSLLEFSALLLLMSGDVESNPGPGTRSPEYDTMVDCTEHIVMIFEEDLLHVNNSMFQSHLIGRELHKHLSNVHVDKHKRATDLFDSLLRNIELKNSEAVFKKCLEVISSLGPNADDTVRHVRETFEKKKKSSQAVKQQQQPLQSVTQTGHDSRINCIAKQVGIDPSLLDHPCGEQHIEKISHKIVYWNSYLRFLGLNKQKEHAIQTDPTLHAPNAKSLRMLEWWQQNTHDKPAGKVRHLLRGVLEIEGNAKLVGEICAIVRDYNPDYDPQQETDQGVHSASSLETPPLDKHLNQPTEETVKEQDRDDTEPEHFCTLPAFDHSLPKPSSQNGSHGAAHAQAATDKLWPPQQGVILVYFMYPSALNSLGLNEDNIISWANVWRTQYNRGIVPYFKQTKDKKQADIRVYVCSGGGSWSKVGTDAGLVTDPGKPTMTLGLIKGKTDYNTHIVIHEFGHALGLEHEHQRSKFWIIAEKFLDIQAMMKDPNLAGTDVKGDYLEANHCGAGSSNYDPESIMHYWFDKKWFKEAWYKNLGKVKRASTQLLGHDDKHVIMGIHKRHQNLAEFPSHTDYEFLKECYQRKEQSNTPGPHAPPAASNASNPPPPTTGDGQEPNDSFEEQVSEPTQSMSHNQQGIRSQMVAVHGPVKATTQPKEEMLEYRMVKNSQPKPLSASKGVAPLHDTAIIRSDQDSEAMTAATGGWPGESYLPPPSQASPDDNIIERDMAAINLSDQPSTSLSQLMEELSIIAHEAQEEEVVQELQQLRSHWESNVIKIGVIGATNSGKSTTINAILHGKYLPASSGSNTARVVLITHDVEATECKLSDSQHVQLAVGRENIHSELKKLNRKQKNDGEAAICQSLLHIYVSRPFNIQAAGCCLQLYDTPGMSEDKQGAIYQDAKKAMEKMDGIIVVLSHETLDHRETTALIDDLREWYPNLHYPTARRRALILMNKSDELEKDDEDDIAEKKEQASTGLKLHPEQILYYSAKLAVTSRTTDTSLVEQDDFQDLRHLVKKNKDVTRQLRECYDYNPENVKRVTNIVEEVSKIKIVEERIGEFLPGLKDRKVVVSLEELVTKLDSHHSHRLGNFKQKLAKVSILLV